MWVCLTLPSFASHLCEQLAFAAYELTTFLLAHTQTTQHIPMSTLWHALCVLYTYVHRPRALSVRLWVCECLRRRRHGAWIGNPQPIGSNGGIDNTASRCIEQMCSSEFATKYAHSFLKWKHTYVTVFRWMFSTDLARARVAVSYKRVDVNGDWCWAGACECAIFADIYCIKTNIVTSSMCVCDYPSHTMLMLLEILQYESTRTGVCLKNSAIKTNGT